MSYIVNHIVFTLSRNNIIKEEEEAIYIYGLEYIFMHIFFLLTSVIIGIFLNQIINTIIFIVGFSLIRGAGGGVHADKYYKCFILSIGVYIGTIVLNMLLPPEYKIACLLFLLIGDIILFLIAPTQNLVNPKTPEELKSNRYKMLLIMFIYNVISLYFIRIPALQNVSFILSIVIFVLAILNIINYIQGVFNYEKRNEN